jgi:hypothetical protein
VEQRQAQGEQGLLSKQVTAELTAIGQQDANLASEFTAKLTESCSILEAMSASQIT